MGIEKPLMADIGVQIGDFVEIKSGPMEGFSGKIASVDPANGKVGVLVSMFNRETQIEIDYSQVAPVD